MPTILLWEVFDISERSKVTQRFIFAFKCDIRIYNVHVIADL